MESLTSYTAHMETLRGQAGALASACRSLAFLLGKEASRLKRKDEAARLMALRSTITQRLDRARSMEAAASYGHSKARLLTSLGGLLLGGALKLASRDRRIRAVTDHVLNNLGGEDVPFGTAMVCIGPNGVPDDVAVVSISRLARESSRAEAEVIHDIRKRGCLLFNEGDFSLLIDRLTDDVHEGRLSLPITAETLSQIGPSSPPRPAIKQPRWVPVRRPQ